MDDGLFEELLDGIADMKQHQAGNMVGGARIHVPQQIDVLAVRKKLGMTQREFCATFGMAESTLKSWEGGSRSPEGSARVLLSMIAKDAQAVLRLAGQ